MLRFLTLVAQGNPHRLQLVQLPLVLTFAPLGHPLDMLDEASLLAQVVPQLVYFIGEAPQLNLGFLEGDIILGG